MCEWIYLLGVEPSDLNNEKFRVLPWPRYVPQWTFKGLLVIGGYLLMHYMHDGKLLMWE